MPALNVICIRRSPHNYHSNGQSESQPIGDPTEMCMPNLVVIELKIRWAFIGDQDLLKADITNLD